VKTSNASGEKLRRMKPSDAASYLGVSWARMSWLVASGAPPHTVDRLDLRGR
jgi:hypothetical protein